MLRSRPCPRVTAGMILVITTDGVLLIGADGWVFVKSIRNSYYHLTITFVCVTVVLVVGGVEAIGFLKDQFNLTGRVWDCIGYLNDNFSTLGFVTISVFTLSRIGSMIVYRAKRFGRLATTNPAADHALSAGTPVSGAPHTWRLPGRDATRTIRITLLSGTCPRAGSGHCIRAPSVGFNNRTYAGRMRFRHFTTAQRGMPAWQRSAGFRSPYTGHRWSFSPT